MIEFICSNSECRTKLQVGDELAGKKVRCPKCKTVSVAPEAGPVTSDKRSVASGGRAEGKERGGVEELDAFLEEKRGRRAPFDVEKEIARGGMGAVILARDKAIQRELAVKVMRPQIADSEEHRLRFLEEAQVTGQLEHPNIVPIHELGKDADGNLYFTMKLVKGKSLGETLKAQRSSALQSGESGRGSGLQAGVRSAEAQDHAGLESSATMSLSDLLGIFLKVCDGIAFAHSRGVIHRDLKPDNIMVGEFGEVQIMDWGLAKVLRTDRGTVGPSDRGTEEGREEDQRPAIEGSPAGKTRDQRPQSAIPDESAIRKADTVPAGGPQSGIRNQESVRSVRSGSDIALTVDGQITGTPAYMPPEQAEGKLEMIDHRSDVYSLGAILYEILTLERPIEGDTVHKVLLNVADGKVTPPEQRTPYRHIPKELSAVVMKAMTKNRRKRYQSVQELSQDIKLFQEGRSVSAKADSLMESVIKLVKRNRGISIATGVAAAVLLVGAVVGVVKIAAERNEAVRQKKVAEGALEQARRADEAKAEMSLKASRELAEQTARAAGEGRFDEAGIRADAAEKLASWGPWGLFAKGAIAWERKELEKAEEHLKAAREIATEDPSIRNLLVRVQAATGKAKEAAALLDNLDKIEKWEDLLAAGDVLYGVEDYRRAQTLYDAAVKKMKVDPTVTPERLSVAEDKLGNAAAWIKCEGFYESIRDLPAKEQYARIAAKLEEIHGYRAGLLPPTIEGGALQGIAWSGGSGGKARFLQPLWKVPLRSLSLQSCSKLRDLSPLRGMPLRKLFLASCARLRELSPLKGMPLTHLDCTGTQVSDLRPLEGMQLITLNCYCARRVTDLSPIGGMPITDLNCYGTGVSDLSPLKGMPLKKLTCGGTPVTDLRPLKGMPLTMLNCQATQVSDLGPLGDMPLKELICGGAPVSDLSPLRGAPLTTLKCQGTQVSDLDPLAGMPLTKLDCSVTGVDDLAPLQGAPLWELQCQSTAVSDLRPLAGMPLKRLSCANTLVTDLSPLRGVPLTYLYCAGTNISDLGPLEGMPLTTLLCYQTQVSDLSPLRGMRLTELHCYETQVADLSPLQGMPLKDLRCHDSLVVDLSPLEGLPLTRLAINDTEVADLTPLKGMDLEILFFMPRNVTTGIDTVRGMTSIKSIGVEWNKGMPPAEFWKKYDAGEFR